MYTDPVRRRDGTLTRRVTDALRDDIRAGKLAPGQKLPSEAQLIDLFKVSRTVVREALSVLREERLVDPRQGAGVFVLDSPKPDRDLFSTIDPKRISSVVEALELRTAIEVEAAYLAAARCSPLQEELIVRRHQEVGTCIREGRSTIEADLAFHLAIAEAGNNQRFVDLLKLLGREMIPRAALNAVGIDTETSYLEGVHREHWQIVDAISSGDQIGAREAMRAHLVTSQKRYKSFLSASERNLL
jgi:GntR family transcriptional repressor for pyruvate dehydrogenase complex